MVRHFSTNNYTHTRSNMRYKKLPQNPTNNRMLYGELCGYESENEHFYGKINQVSQFVK